MTPFLILSWPDDCPHAAAAARKIRMALRMMHPPWAPLLDEPGKLVAIKPGRPVIWRRSDRGPMALIGDVFARGSRPPDRLLDASDNFPDLCRDLTEHFWGAYVAVQLGEGGAISIFRDPIGMHDTVTWSRSNLRVVASGALPWLSLAAPENLTIDWDRMGELLCDSSTVAEATPLSAIETLAPGTLIECSDGERQARRLWTPRQYYDGGRTQSSAGELGSVAKHCIDAWLKTYPNHGMEISGGFDSAVIAAMAAGASRRPRFGVNFFTDDFAGDERRYARDVAERNGIALHEIFMPVGAFDATDFEDMPVGVRPGLGSTSLVHDRLLADLAAAKGVSALITGHGGDAVFFQHPTLTIASDRSFPRMKMQAYRDLARWTKSSFWSVARHAFRIGGGPSQRSEAAVVSLPIAADFHAPASVWAGDLDELPPAKALHIDAIAGDRSAFGPSWRSQSLTVVHPLLSQPLVELAIAIDAFHLTNGRRDRALARDAFSRLLPESIVERRGKGALGTFFGRLLAASTTFLRSYLLDGELVGKGLIDAHRLEPMLDRDYLMRVDCYGGLLSALLMEHWARTWRDRLAAVREIGSESVPPSSAPAN